MSDENAKKYSVVKAKFESHFVKKRNVIYERAKFNQRKQDEDETVDAFVTALYELAEHCSYGDLHDELIRDRLVVGIKDVKLSEKLQLDPELTLEKAITQSRQAETIKQQQPLLRGGQINESPIADIRGKPSSSQSSMGPCPVSQHKSYTQSCSWCGKSPRHDRQHCQARDATCRKCGKKGHSNSVCRSYPKKVRGIGTDPQTSQEDQSVYEDEQSVDGFLGTLSSDNTTDSPWSVTLQLNGTEVTFHIDTGAEVTVISDTEYQKLGNVTLIQTDQTLKGPSNQPLQVKGKFFGEFHYGLMRIKQSCYVVTGLAKPLLGRPAIEKLNLLARINNVQGVSITEKFSKLFTGLGKLPGCYTIKLSDGAKPYLVNVP